MGGRSRALLTGLLSLVIAAQALGAGCARTLANAEQVPWANLPLEVTVVSADLVVGAGEGGPTASLCEATVALRNDAPVAVAGVAVTAVQIRHLIDIGLDGAPLVDAAVPANAAPESLGGRDQALVYLELSLGNTPLPCDEPMALYFEVTAEGLSALVPGPTVEVRCE